MSDSVAVETIKVSDVCKVFYDRAVGTKVLRSAEFFVALVEAIKNYTFPENGQGFIPMPEHKHLVSAGEGLYEGKASDDFVVRIWRGRPEVFLKRKYAEPCTFLAAVVYTIEAYRADPDVTDEELSWFGPDVTHVLVAVIGAAAPEPPCGPYRFVKNLAGGNNEELAMSADEIRAKAKKVIEHHDKWCVVADE